jgi:hypothetical protein
MRKVIVVEWMTLDGVVQAPGAADEDTSGGFQHGGWHLPYFDDLARSWVVNGYATAGGFLLGHRTYENLAAYWPNASEEEQPVAEPLPLRPTLSSKSSEDGASPARIASSSRSWPARCATSRKSPAASPGSDRSPPAWCTPARCPGAASPPQASATATAVGVAGPQSRRRRGRGRGRPGRGRPRSAPGHRRGPRGLAMSASFPLVGR